MKVLLINGSPNINGCTYTALNEIAKNLNMEYEIVSIGNEAHYGCNGCGACKKTNRCIHDDIVNVLLDKFDSCDGLVIGSPVYYASANGSLISILDRFFTAGNSFNYKVAAAISSGRRAGTTLTVDQINKYFVVKNMITISGGYWNMVHGNNPLDVLKDEEGLQIMQNISKNMNWILSLIDCGKKNGINMPVYDKKIKTNFIK